MQGSSQRSRKLAQNSLRLVVQHSSSVSFTIKKARFFALGVSRPSYSCRTFSSVKNVPVDDKNVKPKIKSSLSLYSDLAKARLSALVVTTTAAGYLAAGPHVFDTESFAAVLIGTGLCSSSAAAWNQIFEVKRDAKMKRTIQRSLVTGDLSIRNACVAATIWGIGGPMILYSFCGVAPAVLGVSNMVLYAGVYTALKPVSVTNTWVGAVVGAIPPIMGYAAATQVVLDPISANLGALLYLWQLPHFMALSFMYRADYARGGFAMLPCIDEAKTADVMVRYSYYTAAVPFVSTALDVTSSMFALEGLFLNGYAIAVAHRFRQDRSNQNARKVFLTSLWYLPCTLMLFLLHSKTWDETSPEEQMDESPIRRLSNAVQFVRKRGRELCLHESIAQEKSSSCPIVVAEDAVEAATAVTKSATTDEEPDR